MFKKKELAKKIGLGMCLIATASLLNGCDETYNLSDLGGDITLFEGGVSAPVGDTEKFYLSDFIEENDLLQVDSLGRYTISYSGDASTSLSFPSVDVPAFEPTFASTHLDFFESVKNSSDPTMQAIVTLIEQYLGSSFDHNSVIPEIKNPLTGENIPLNVPAVHAEIPRAVEEFEMDIYGIPEELVSISKIVLCDNAQVELTLHAEGFPETIDEISLDFYIHPPVQLHISPVDNSIEVNKDNGYIHIAHTLPCVNGKLDDRVLFNLDYIEFKEPLMRQEDGKLAIFAELDYEGKIDIEKEFDLTGWKPVLDFNIGFHIDEFSVESAKAQVQAQVEPIELSQEIAGLPDLLTNPNNCFDLSYIYLNLNIDNTTPASLMADFALQSTFHDGTQSEVVATQEPICIEANKNQHIAVTNDGKHAGEPGYIPALNEIMYKLPKSLSLKATPYIPLTDIDLKLNSVYNVAIDYSLAVPIVFGDDFELSLEGDFGDLGTDIAALSENASSVALMANVVSTLPADITMEVKPVDANGKELKGLTITGVPLTLKAADTTKLNIVIEAAEENELNKLYTLQYKLSAKASGENNELRSDQYLQFTDITLSLPQGISIML